MEKSNLVSRAVTLYAMASATDHSFCLRHIFPLKYEKHNIKNVGPGPESLNRGAALRTYFWRTNAQYFFAKLCGCHP